MVVINSFFSSSRFSPDSMYSGVSGIRKHFVVALIEIDSDTDFFKAIYEGVVTFRSKIEFIFAVP